MRGEVAISLATTLVILSSVGVGRPLGCLRSKWASRYSFDWKYYMKRLTSGIKERNGYIICTKDWKVKNKIHTLVQMWHLKIGLLRVFC